ncbi:recombinase family protein, partial [Klebsiella pneumoniae]|uniref:recombinase family protein n=1 Tax=Klebsiella pneumoniae TaxID=573 RepID=UPI0033158F7F
MHGQRIGYVRVSSFDQNPERQLEQIQVDKVFTDKASGKDTRRPELERLLAFVREGDTVVVHSMDRLARNGTVAKLAMRQPFVLFKGL